MAVVMLDAFTGPEMPSRVAAEVGTDFPDRLDRGRALGTRYHDSRSPVLPACRVHPLEAALDLG
jgi:hypothetical protein